jgi:hypothetical protein
MVSVAVNAVTVQCSTDGGNKRADSRFAEAMKTNSVRRRRPYEVQLPESRTDLRDRATGGGSPMRYILIFWGLPMGVFWAWYLLSYHDINFGLLFFSRQVHDFAFTFYGNLLGIEPSTIPPLVIRACIVDTGLIFGIYALRKRKAIMAWWRERRGTALGLMPASAHEAGRVPPAE